VKVHLPKTADGRHCDFAPSIALAAHYAQVMQGSDEPVMFISTGRINGGDAGRVTYGGRRMTAMKRALSDS
jgi:hypothetical protein